jgi:hypothetical protein
MNRQTDMASLVRIHVVQRTHKCEERLFHNVMEVLNYFTYIIICGLFHDDVSGSDYQNWGSDVI